MLIKIFSGLINFRAEAEKSARRLLQWKMHWEDVHRAAVYAEVNSGKHNKKNGKENLAEAAAAAARTLATLLPGTTTKQCLLLVRNECV